MAAQHKLLESNPMQVLASDERMGEGHSLPLGLKGFHPMNPGVEFRQAYRWGLSGPYLRFTKVRPLA